MKNKVLYFSLYDFANSAFTTIIITFIFSTYFSQQIAPSNIIGQSYWGWTIGASGFLVAILGPIIGSISDKNNYNVYFLRTFTALCILTTCLLWFSKPSINFFYFTLIIVGIANFFYEVSLIFYNSLLIRVSSREKIGKSSGYGFALGYLGGLLALLVSIKIFIQADFLSKEQAQNIRLISFFVSFWFLIFSLPFLVKVKKYFSIKKAGMKTKVVTIKNLIWNKKITEMGKFLIGRMLYADGLNAIIVMGGIFAVGVYGLKISELLYLSVLMNITAFLGALAGGYFNDKYGSKKVIVFSLVGLIITSSLILAVSSKEYFLFLASLNGFFIGPVQSASRVVISKMINKNDQNKAFGLFATSGKLTSFLGPMLVGTITMLSNSQKIGFSSAIFLLLIGLVIILKIKKIQ